MSHILRTSTEHITAPLADEGSYAYCQSIIILQLATDLRLRRDYIFRIGGGSCCSGWTLFISGKTCYSSILFSSCSVFGNLVVSSTCLKCATFIFFGYLFSFYHGFSCYLDTYVTFKGSELNFFKDCPLSDTLSGIPYTLNVPFTLFITFYAVVEFAKSTSGNFDLRSIVTNMYFYLINGPRKSTLIMASVMVLMVLVR